MGGLANLTNHPLETWPAAQREAALCRWGRVLELASGATLVPVEAEAEAVVAQGRALVAEVLARGASCALVAGELRLTVVLVALLQARGVTCITTVAEREVNEEPLPDGSVRVVRSYRFAGFREVPVVAGLR